MVAAYCTLAHERCTTITLSLSASPGDRANLNMYERLERCSSSLVTKQQTLSLWKLYCIWCIQLKAPFVTPNCNTGATVVRVYPCSCGFFHPVNWIVSNIDRLFNTAQFKVDGGRKARLHSLDECISLPQMVLLRHVPNNRLTTASNVKTSDILMTCFTRYFPVWWSISHQLVI